MGSSRLTHILDSPSSTIYVMFFSNRLGTSTTLLELLQLLLTKCCCVTIHYLVPNLIFNNNVFWVLFFFCILAKQRACSSKGLCNVNMHSDSPSTDCWGIRLGQYLSGQSTMRLRPDAWWVALENGLFMDVAMCCSR